MLSICSKKPRTLFYATLCVISGLFLNAADLHVSGELTVRMHRKGVLEQEIPGTFEIAENQLGLFQIKTYIPGIGTASGIKQIVASDHESAYWAITYEDLHSTGRRQQPAIASVVSGEIVRNLPDQWNLAQIVSLAYLLAKNPATCISDGQLKQQLIPDCIQKRVGEEKGRFAIKILKGQSDNISTIEFWATVSKESNPNLVYNLENHPVGVLEIIARDKGMPIKFKFSLLYSQISRDGDTTVGIMEPVPHFELVFQGLAREGVVDILHQVAYDKESVSYVKDFRLDPQKPYGYVLRPSEEIPLMKAAPDAYKKISNNQRIQSESDKSNRSKGLLVASICVFSFSALLYFFVGRKNNAKNNTQ